jgi:hypothetical protein
MLFACQPEREQSGGCHTSDLATGKKQREESRGKERLVVVEQSRSALKLGWPIPSNGAAVTTWCGSSSAALRLGYPWPRGSSLARECMRVHVLGHTAANRGTRCRATTKRWRLSAAGAPSCERRSTVGNGLPSSGLVGSRMCMPKENPRRRAPGGTEKATTRPCALSTEDSTVKGGALVGFWVQLT